MSGKLNSRYLRRLTQGSVSLRWKKLFDTRSINPSNFKLIVSKAVHIKVILKHEGFEVVGARGRVKKGTFWMQPPKISLRSKSGKKLVDLETSNNQKQNKSLIALLYSICHLSNAKQGANLVYLDNKGIQTSLATKHGPDKSEYMKRLISVLEDVEFISGLESEITRPLPNNLTKLEIEIINASEKGVLSTESVDNLLAKHDLSCIQLENTVRDLKANKEVESHRVPKTINWPKISLPDHFDELENKINSALNAANAEIGDLKSELEITKEKLRHTEEYNARVLGRGLFARIFNKK